MSPSVAVILLNWNGTEDTLACLDSLKAVTYAPVTLIVVDNGSEGASPDRIARMHPEVTLLRQPFNVGFAEGNNIGIRHALAQGADFVLLLNNDTAVDPPFIDRLLDAAREHPDAGFFGPKIFYHADPQRIWMGKPRWDPRTCRFVFAGSDELDDTAGLETTTETAFACGCAMLIPRHTIERIGLIDPRFFIYYEEIDWCFRGARAGLKSWYVPQAKIWHKVSRTMGGRTSPVSCYLRARNSLLWAERNLPRRQRLRVFYNHYRDMHRGIGWTETGVLRCLKRWYWNLLILQRDPCLKAWRRGIRDYLLHRFGEPPAALRRLPHPQAGGRVPPAPSG